MAKKTSEQLREDLIEGTYKSVEELIKIMKEPIIGNSSITEDVGGNSEISPDKMKNAASAKKLAYDDCTYLIEKLEIYEQSKAKGTVEEKDLSIPLGKKRH